VMFEVGETVYEIAGLEKQLYRREVVRVMKRFVELNTGSKWDPTGHEYPHRSYSQSSLLKVTDETTARYKRDLALRIINRTKWKDVEPEVLFNVAAALKENQP